MGLQQKHVVAVKVRSHAAAVAGVAHHHIVQARIGHKAKLVTQSPHPGVKQVHALHQQRPAGLLERGQGLAAKRALFQAPGLVGHVGRLDHQARLHVVLRGQVKEFGAVQWRTHARDRLANHQGLFLPMALHEGGGRQAAQELKGLVNVHKAGVLGLKNGEDETATIVRWKFMTTAWSR